MIKKISIEQSVDNIKKLIKNMNCDVSHFTIGNIYDYLNNDENGQEFFDHKYSTF